jgi:hypothetical protein
MEQVWEWIKNHFHPLIRENSAPTPPSFTFCWACGTMMGASSWPVNTSSLFPTLNTVDLFFRDGLKKNPLPPPAPLLPAASSAPSRSSLQGLWNRKKIVAVPVPTYEKFRFRFRLLNSYRMVLVPTFGSDF